jgi:hypothetical protein
MFGEKKIAVSLFHCFTFIFWWISGAPGVSSGTGGPPHRVIKSATSARVRLDDGNHYYIIWLVVWE